MSSTIKALIPVVAAFAGLHVDTADRFACKLRVASLLPDEYAPLDAVHVARLLVATMGSTAPTVAVDVIRIYEALPAITAERRNAVEGALAIGFIPVEDLPIAPGRGRDHNRLTHDFVSALALVIEQAPRPDTTNLGAVSRFGISRTTWAPRAFIETEVQPGVWARAIYARRAEQCDADADYRASTMTTAPGHIIGTLGSLLRPAPSTTIVTAGVQPALPGGQHA